MSLSTFEGTGAAIRTTGARDGLGALAVVVNSFSTDSAMGTLWVIYVRSIGALCGFYGVRIGVIRVY